MSSFIDPISIRQQLRQQRNNLCEKIQAENSQRICQQVQQLPVFQQARSLALYHATEGEPDVFSLTMIKNKRFALPSIAKNNELRFAFFKENDTLTKNRYGILEPPIQSEKISPEAIDIIIIPLVAFDELGHRLGRGAGYYDRTLCFMQKSPRPKKPYLIGVGYEFQKITTIEANSWDINLNIIITEKTIYEVTSP